MRYGTHKDIARRRAAMRYPGYQESAAQNVDMGGLLSDRMLWGPQACC